MSLKSKASFLSVIDDWPEKDSLVWRLITYKKSGQEKAARRKHRPGKILHVLSQQPGKTGSGVYLQALVEHAGKAHFSQRVIVGMPWDSPLPSIPPLHPADIISVRFGGPGLPYPIPGMSDVMPYESTRFSDFTPDMLDNYLKAFSDVLRETVMSFEPDIIHTHHLWLVTALTRILFPDLPLVTTCHGTDLRQHDLAPALSPFVIPGCAAVDRVMALHESHRDRMAHIYGIDKQRIRLIGAGFRDDLFCSPGPSACKPVEKHTLTIVYAGKISKAKGVHCLIDAMKFLQGRTFVSLLRDQQVGMKEKSYGSRPHRIQGYHSSALCRRKSLLKYFNPLMSLYCPPFMRVFHSLFLSQSPAAAVLL
jgi:glycosyltransferase involved in cell wall biosynthesis